MQPAEAGALLSPGTEGFGAEKVVALDVILAIACLVCAGELHERLQVVCWALDR
jgi:hypothetical protein